MSIVTVDQIKVGVRKYVENEIAYKAEGLTKFLVFFIAPSIEKEVSSLVAKAKESAMFKELFTEEGNVLLEDVYQRARVAAEKSGKIVLEKYNIAMDQTDVDKLYRYISGV